MFVKHQLVGDTYLMVGMFEAQLVEGLLVGVYSREVEIDSVEHLVIGNTTFNNIIYRVALSFTACRDIIEPFTIVSIEDNAGELLQLFVQFIDVHYGSFAFAQETLPIFFSLFAQ